MISILSMAINTAISFILYILQAVFSMLVWFLKAFFRFLKLFFSLLPFTAIVFSIFFVVCLFTVVSGTGSESFLPASFEIGGSSFYIASKDAAIPLFSTLIRWWEVNVLSTKGSFAFVVLMILTILMFLPVTSVFLCIAVVMSYGQLLFYAILIDAAIYLVFAVFAKSFAAQFLSRYYFLFPEAGKKHYEKSYDKWLRRHHKEFEDDSYVDPEHRQRRKVSEFYGDEEGFGNEDSRDQRFSDDYEDDSYEDDSHEDEYYEDDENYYEDSEEDEDDRDIVESHRGRHRKSRVLSFFRDKSYDDDYYEENDDFDIDDSDSYDEDYDEGDCAGYDRGYDEDDSDGCDDDYEGDYDDPSPLTSFNFFAGCTSRESVEKKYRSLAKLYHPDNMDGDTASLQEINAQYELAKKRFPR